MLQRDNVEYYRQVEQLRGMKERCIDVKAKMEKELAFMIKMDRNITDQIHLQNYDYGARKLTR